MILNAALHLDLRIDAYRAVWRAISQGKVDKPKECQRCFKTNTTIYGHHGDYSKPLEVEWLCGSCHKREHYRLAAKVNGTKGKSTNRA